MPCSRAGGAAGPDRRAAQALHRLHRAARAGCRVHQVACCGGVGAVLQLRDFCFSGSSSSSGGEIKRALYVGRTCRALSEVVHRQSSRSAVRACRVTDVRAQGGFFRENSHYARR